MSKTGWGFPVVLNAEQLERARQFLGVTDTVTSGTYTGNKDVDLEWKEMPNNTIYITVDKLKTLEAKLASQDVIQKRVTNALVGSVQLHHSLQRLVN